MEQIENRKSKIENRGRAALFWGAAALVALQIGLAAAIERRLPELRDPNYTYKAARLRRRLAGALEPPLTVVVLGSSRTAFGLRGAGIEPGLAQAAGRPVALFNFGLVGAGPLVELVTLRRLLADGVRPDLLVAEVLPPLFNQRLATYELGQLPPERLWRREVPLLARYGASPDRWRRGWWMSFLTPWYAHRLAIVSRVSPALLNWRERQDGFSGVDGCGWAELPARLITPETRRAALEQARREYAGPLANFHLGGPSCDALRELLALCRQEGIPVALLWMPEGAVFRGWYPPAAQRQIDAYLAELDVPLIDARHWLADEEFADGHHLLPHGVERFSARLGREALPPLLRRLPRKRDASASREEP